MVIVLAGRALAATSPVGFRGSNMDAASDDMGGAVTGGGWYCF